MNDVDRRVIDELLAMGVDNGGDATLVVNPAATTRPTIDLGGTAVPIIESDLVPRGRIVLLNLRKLAEPYEPKTLDPLSLRDEEVRDRA